MKGKLMIITNIPIMLLIWAVEFYVFMIIVRLLLANFKITANNVHCLNLKEMVDPAHAKVKAFLMKYYAVPDWVSWTVFIFGLLIVRKLLIVLL